MMVGCPSFHYNIGTFQNVTSAGKASPGRTRTLKDQELMLNEYKKENFGLKLRIYHLEEALRKRWGEKDDGWKMVSFTLSYEAMDSSCGSTVCITSGRRTCAYYQC